jgi:hypothetical protein
LAAKWLLLEQFVRETHSMPDDFVRETRYMPDDGRETHSMADGGLLTLVEIGR